MVLSPARYTLDPDNPEEEEEVEKADVKLVWNSRRMLLHRVQASFLYCRVPSMHSALLIFQAYVQPNWRSVNND